MTMQNDLMALKNLGNTSVNWLLAVGIHNRAELERVGSVQAYNRIRERGIKVSKVLLYALQGALLNVHWTQLDELEKKRLVIEAERGLATIGNDATIGATTGSDNTNDNS
ncbi:MAG TPA: TfoX/Sxy family protein [Spongiibacteraceae bacterium]|jgi:DNA transformation protein